MSATSDRRAVLDVVLSQLAAMREGDWETVRALSARELRERWSAERLAEVARAGYAPLLGSVGQRVEQVEIEDDAARCRLTLMRRDGSSLIARYELRREEDTWRVAGIALGATLTAVLSMNGGRRRRR
jgi:hypothetical protein